MSYYDILAIPRDAPVADIERAFRALARQVHPDLNRADANAGARMKQLNEIRATLTDPLLRAAYDQELRQQDADAASAAARAARTATAADRPPPAWQAASAHSARASAAGAGTSWAKTMRPKVQEGRWFMNLALMALLCGGLLGYQSLRHPRIWTPPLAAASVSPLAATSGDEGVGRGNPPDDAPGSSAARPLLRPPRARASSAHAAEPARKGAASARTGVVGIGSTSDQVLRAFGPPDRVERGARPGDATMFYGSLRLELRNGRVR